MGADKAKTRDQPGIQALTTPCRTEAGGVGAGRVDGFERMIVAGVAISLMGGLIQTDVGTLLGVGAAERKSGRGATM